MVKFVANKKDFLSIISFLFFVLENLHLHMSFDIVNLLDITTHERINKKSYKYF